jgi:hypothetical protein
VHATDGKYADMVVDETPDWRRGANGHTIRPMCCLISVYV